MDRFVRFGMMGIVVAALALLLSSPRAGASSIVVDGELILCVGNLLGTVRAVSSESKCKSWETAVTIPLDIASGSVIGGAGKPKKNATRFISMFFNGEADAGNESEVEQFIPSCGVVSNLYVNSKKPQFNGSGQYYDFTLRRNGADTPVTCRMADPASDCSDTINSEVYQQGDKITLKAVPSASPAPNKEEEVRWTATFTPLDPDNPLCESW